MAAASSVSSHPSSPNRKSLSKEPRRMTSAAPARKPYRKAPPQHRETRHALPAAPPAPTPQHDLSQVNQHSLSMPPPTSLQRCVSAERPRGHGPRRGGRRSPLPHSDSEVDVSSLSSIEVTAPPPGRRRSQRTRPGRTVSSQSHAAARKLSPGHRLAEDRHLSTQWSHAPAAPPAAPRSILKQPGSLGLKHTYDIIRKSQSVELLGDSGGKDQQPPLRPLRRSERDEASRRSSDPSSPCDQKMNVLKEKVRFSNFLDEITCRVMSPAHLRQLGKPPPLRGHGNPAAQLRREDRGEWSYEETSAERSRRWDNWVSSVQQPHALHLQEEAGHQKADAVERAPRKREKGASTDAQKRHKHSLPLSNQAAHVKVGLLHATSRWRFLEEWVCVVASPPVFP